MLSLLRVEKRVPLGYRQESTTYNHISNQLSNLWKTKNLNLENEISLIYRPRFVLRVRSHFLGEKSGRDVGMRSNIVVRGVKESSILSIINQSNILELDVLLMIYKDQSHQKIKSYFIYTFVCILSLSILSHSVIPEYADITIILLIISTIIVSIFFFIKNEKERVKKLLSNWLRETIYLISIKLVWWRWWTFICLFSDKNNTLFEVVLPKIEKYNNRWFATKQWKALWNMIKAIREERHPYNSRKLAFQNQKEEYSEYTATLIREKWEKSNFIVVC